MDETLALINKAANERHSLYKVAGREHLTPAQLSRLHELDNELPLLWDRYRRELASDKYRPVARTTDATRKAA